VTGRVMTRHQQVRFYDPHMDAEAVRISGFDDRGDEFWMKRRLAPEGALRRIQREEALSAIAEAIEAGLEPGEVIVDG
jgi:hypothetical protein